MEQPTFADYVRLIYTLYERFVQENEALKALLGRYEYPAQGMMVFFVMMQYRRVFQFKTQWRWLEAHPTERQTLGFESVPHRTTLSRRYKGLYQILQAFIAYVGRDAQTLDESFESHDLYQDKSLFKAQGPVWHETDRQAGRVPDKLRHLDKEATWSKSGYHGWVYGYGLHVTCNRIGFPKLVQVETACVSEKQVMDDQQAYFLNILRPATLSADNSYAQARRIRAWAKAGVALLTPATQWVKGRYAIAYHRYLKRPHIALRLRDRRTAIEPFFDLSAQILGTTNNHKQLPLQRLANVRTCLALAVLSLQIAMFANSLWGISLRSISPMRGAFS